MKGSQKGTERNKNQAAAGRLAHLRNARFTTEGVTDNMSVSDARRIASRNMRGMASVPRTVSVRA